MGENPVLFLQLCVGLKLSQNIYFEIKKAFLVNKVSWDTGKLNSLLRLPRLYIKRST